MSENLVENQTVLTETITETPTTETPVETKVEKVVPEDYTFTLPEGVELDKDLVAEFKPLAKELGLSQEEAQKLVDVQLKAAEKLANETAAAWNTQVDTWKKDAENDKEYGGQNLTANIAVARTALDKFGTPELKQALNAFGMGNHPELIRFMYRVGKAITEDTTVVSGKPVEAANRGAEYYLYPSMQKGN